MNKAQGRLRLNFSVAALPFLVATAWLFALRGDCAIIWNGSTTNYTQPGTDSTQPTNQDRLTPSIWLTRATLEGLYNARTEGGYTHYFSPADTEWAYGELSNYTTLTYTNWEGWNAHNPPSMVGQDAVVHLISENIYLSLQFTSWGGPGSGFSYTRSTPGVAPVAPALNPATASSNGTFQFSFTNVPGYNFTILATTNISLPQGSWDVLGTATYGPAGPGFYQFVDPGAGTNQPHRVYRVSWP